MGHPAKDTPTKREKFERTWPLVRDELLNHFKGQEMPRDAIEWYGKSLNYNVPGGKLTRALSVIDTAEILKGRPLTDSEYLKAAILGWCIELAFLLVADDLMDEGITRRGHPCWHRVDNAGNIAFNDAMILEAALYHLLRTHFRHESYYVDILELFHDTTYKTEMGQLVDMITSPPDVVNLTNFSFDKHSLIATYKTGYYSFYLPVALAMYFCHIPTSYTIGSRTVNPYSISLSVFHPLGVYYQVQDDVLDFANTVEQTGKVGTDIIDNKCTWPIITAITLASPEQKKILEENYGKKGKEEEERVKKVYRELAIVEKFDEYEKEMLNKLDKLINVIPVEDGRDGILKKEVFTCFLAKLHKRTR